MSAPSALSGRVVDDAAIIDTIRRLVECESPSADLAALHRSADLIAAIGSELLGTRPERIDVDGVPHLRWRFGSTTRVLLLAHHDTVWPMGTIDRLPYDVRDGALTGPGCFDMKTGLAMALHAVSSLDDRDGITLLVTGDEELGSPRSRALIEETAAGANAALVLEAAGDGGALKVERKGISLYEMVISAGPDAGTLSVMSGLTTLLGAVATLMAIATGTTLGDIIVSPVGRRWSRAHWDKRRRRQG